MIEIMYFENNGISHEKVSVEYSDSFSPSVAPVGDIVISIDHEIGQKIEKWHQMNKLSILHSRINCIF